MQSTAGGGSGSRGSGPVIDTHIHAVPASLVREVEAAAFRGVSADRSEAGLRFRFPGMQPSPPAPAGLTDFVALAARGLKQGIDAQIVAPWTDLLGYTLRRRDASTWSHAYNEAQASACRERPALVPIATIPLQFPDLAAASLVRARGLGCRGVIVGTDVPGIALDAAALEPVWEAASGLGMPVFVHPTFLTVPGSMQTRGLKNAVGRIGETTLTLTRLVYSGILLRYPDLIVIAALGGGALVPARHRVLRNHVLGWSETKTDVEASLRRLYFDTVVLDSGFLRYLVGEMGADRFVMGSDYPFPWEPDPVAMVLGAALPAQAAQAILGATASRLFGIESMVPPVPEGEGPAPADREGRRGRGEPSEKRE